MLLFQGQTILVYRKSPYESINENVNPLHFPLGELLLSNEKKTDCLGYIVHENYPVMWRLH